MDRVEMHRAGSRPALLACPRAVGLRRFLQTAYFFLAAFFLPAFFAFRFAIDILLVSWSDDPSDRRGRARNSENVRDLLHYNV